MTPTFIIFRNGEKVHQHGGINETNLHRVRLAACRWWQRWLAAVNGSGLAGFGWLGGHQMQLLPCRLPLVAALAGCCEWLAGWSPDAGAAAAGSSASVLLPFKP